MSSKLICKLIQIHRWIVVGRCVKSTGIRKNSDLPLITCIMISASPSTSLEPWLLPVSSTGSWTQNDPRYLKLWERWLSFIIIVAEALLICRHQGSGCCFSCTAKFHRNRFSCPKCQGRSFTLVSSTLPCWTIYSRWSLTVSLTTEQVELCSEGNQKRKMD